MNFLEQIKVLQQKNAAGTITPADIAALLALLEALAPLLASLFGGSTLVLPTTASK